MILRVIGGTYRGRILEEFKGQDVRPTSDMARESLFNILGDKIVGAHFLDLFAGTGAVGIEALSRGAQSVTFNDKSKESVALITKNLKKLNVTKGVMVSNAQATFFLNNSSSKFDFIYIDPPYKLDLGKQMVGLALSKINDNGIIILEDEKPFEYEIQGARIFDQRKYGRVHLTFFKKHTKIPACVFAGTFDCFTSGHYDIVKRQLLDYEKVIVAIGVNPNKTPFFTKEERLEILNAVFEGENRVEVTSFDGYLVDFMKSMDITHTIRGIRNDSDMLYEQQMAEFNKKLYPEICTVFVASSNDNKVKEKQKMDKISSTLVRQRLLEGKSVKGLVPEKALPVIDKIMQKKKIWG